MLRSQGKPYLWSYDSHFFIASLAKLLLFESLFNIFYLRKSFPTKVLSETHSISTTMCLRRLVCLKAQSYIQFFIKNEYTLVGETFLGGSGKLWSKQEKTNPRKVFSDKMYLFIFSMMFRISMNNDLLYLLFENVWNLYFELLWDKDRIGRIKTHLLIFFSYSINQIIVECIGQNIYNQIVWYITQTSLTKPFSDHVFSAPLFPELNGYSVLQPDPRWCRHHL